MPMLLWWLVKSVLTKYRRRDGHTEKHETGPSYWLEISNCEGLPKIRTGLWKVGHIPVLYPIYWFYFWLAYERFYFWPSLATLYFKCFCLLEFWAKNYFIVLLIHFSSYTRSFLSSQDMKSVFWELIHRTTLLTRRHARTHTWKPRI